MRFKAVIFDLDGTLLDTIEDLTDSMNASLAQMGYPTKTVDECKILVGDGLGTFISRSLPRLAPTTPKPPGGSASSSGPNTASETPTKPGPTPGSAKCSPPWAEKASPLPSYPINLTIPPWKSSKSISRTSIFASFSGPARMCRSSPIPRAPWPSPACWASPPAEILYVGDTNTDMQTAAAAGMFAVGVLWGFRTAEELKKNGARVLVVRPMELFDLVD